VEVEQSYNKYNDDLYQPIMPMFSFTVEKQILEKDELYRRLTGLPPIKEKVQSKTFATWYVK
jgi:hypothetical protein